MQITHYDLFAGIGGFSYALDTIFNDAQIKHIFCEWEAFPAAVLKKHWPDATYYGDIADLVADTERTRCEGELRDTEGQHRLRDRSGKNQDITILTGGFPCQPFSQAGRRQGTSDDRYKWPEMFAVIRNVRPDWVIAENVRGLVTWNDGMVLETVCTDLEAEGYEVQPLIIPACAVGAPHRRDRVWIVANLRSAEPRRLPSGKREEISTTREPNSVPSSNTRQQLREQGSSKGVEASATIGTTSTETNQREHQYTWADDWREVAFATCHDREHDGLSYWLDCITKEEELAYGTSNDTINRQKMLEMWEFIQQNEIWDSFRRCYQIQEAEILYEALREFSEKPEVLEQRASQQGASFEKKIVRDMWKQEQASRSSRRREFIQQYQGEHKDSLRNLPQETSLAVMEAWHILQLLRQALIPQDAVMDGVAISASRHRKERLKACGNAIVPQVAMEIFKAIRYDKVSGTER